MYDEIQANRRSQKAPKRRMRRIVEMEAARKSDRAIVARMAVRKRCGVGEVR